MGAEATKRSYLGHDARRAQILAVAARLFSEMGYDAVSTVQIAREADIARGLLHHYFGAKRDLYLEVLRRMLTTPDDVFENIAGDMPGSTAALAEAVDRWLDTTSRNRETWLAAVGAQGFGRDPEIEAVLAEAGDRIAEQIIALSWGPPAEAPPELRALIVGYGGFAQTLTADWLQRDRLSREQLHALLLQTLIALVGDVLPRVQPNTRKVT